MYILPVNYNFNNISFSKNKIPVYAIDSEGNYIRFDSKKQAAKELGITIADIHRSSKNRSHKAKGYYIVDADEIETKFDNGEIAVYRSKIDKILDFRKNSKAIYAIDIDGNYRKFESQTQASEELGALNENISQAIKGKIGICKGYTFVRADDVEKINEHGETIVDESKIKEIAENRFFKKAIYAIDIDGSYRKFKNQTQAAQELQVSKQYINQALFGKSHTCKGYVIVKASEIERTNQNGESVVDEALLKTAVKKRFLKLNVLA